MILNVDLIVFETYDNTKFTNEKEKFRTQNNIFLNINVVTFLVVIILFLFLFQLSIKLK